MLEAIIIIAALAIFFWTARDARFQLGRRCKRNGLPLNPRWPREQQDGWITEFCSQMDKMTKAELAKKRRRMAHTELDRAGKAA